MNNNDMRAMFAQRQKNEQNKKLTIFRQLNPYAKKGAVLFTGSSLMEQFPVAELCRSMEIDAVVYNRGIGGYTTDDFLNAMGPMLLDLQPGKVFINIGTNDIKDDPAIPEGWQTHLRTNYDAILGQLKAALPTCDVYVMAYYPVNADADCAKNGFMYAALQVRTNEAVKEANAIAAELAEKYGYHYIDANAGLTDEEGRLKEEYTVDGVHMFPEAYAVVLKNLREYI